jgi:hypothetical protein
VSIVIAGCEEDELVIRMCKDARARNACNCVSCGNCSLSQDVLPPSAPEWVCASCGGIKVGPVGRVCGACGKIVCSECFKRMPSTRLGGTCKYCVAERVLSLESEARTITDARSLKIVEQAVAGAAAIAAAVMVCK